MAHTAGPWTLEWNADGETICEIVAPCHEHAHCHKSIVFVHAYGRPMQCGLGPNEEANARLIAAAPDLLAACKAVLSCETHHDEGGRAYLRVPARSLNDLGAAIAEIVAKAEGAQ